MSKKIHALSDLEIKDYFKNNKYFGGVLPKDKLFNLKNKFYIVNMQNDIDPGTHWVLCFNVDKDTCIYFDPYGLPPPENVLKRMLRTDKKCIRSDVQLQNLNTSYCGYFCIYVAERLLNGDSLNYIVTKIFNKKDLNKNEKLLKDFFT
jgi:hypothetical protein